MKKVTFILTLMVSLGLFIGEAQAGPCERRCKTSSVTDDELKECLSKCKPDDDGGGSSSSSGGGGGRIDWCKKFETCKAELLEMIPDCETEDIIPPFEGTCKEQFRSCEAAKKVAPQINTLCANKKGGCELVPCMYMDGAMVPAEACLPGCPEWYNEVDGKCEPVSCEPVCSDDVVARIKVIFGEIPVWLLWLIAGMGGLGLIFLIVLLSRKPPKPEPEPPFVECPKCENNSMQNGKCRNSDCWYQVPDPKAPVQPDKPAVSEDKPTVVKPR